MSIIDSISVSGPNDITVVTVGTQGASGPSQILSKSANDITLASSDNGGAFIYDSGSGVWTVSTQSDSPVVKVRELTFLSGGASVTEILDEDNFASNSNTKLATQQSIKAYVDSQVSASGNQLNVTDGTDTIGIVFASETLTVSGSNGITPTVTNNTISLALPQALGTTDNVTFNNVVVSGNLTVSGTQTTLNTATLSVADNKVVLNSDATGSPTENAGLEVERGDSANVEFLWNETNDRWVADNSLEATSFYVGSTEIVDSSGVWQGPSAGLKGQKGEIGATGSQGTKGQKGEAGEKGQKGQQGNTG